MSQTIKQRLVRAAVRTGAALTRILPRKLWLLIREESALTGRLDYDKAPIYLAVDSWIELDVRLGSCKKEPETVEWIETWFKPGDVFYDIGANVGAYSLVAHAWLKGEGKIYAFEPGFVTFPQLCRNIQLNKGGGAILPFQLALADQPASMIDFHYQNLTTGGALHALGEAVTQEGNDFKPVFTLPTISYRLDDFVRQFNLALPNHIKVDVDGNEWHILNGAQEVLSSPELRTLMIEINDDRAETGQLLALLESRGFTRHSRQSENCLYVRLS